MKQVSGDTRCNDLPILTGQDGQEYPMDAEEAEAFSQYFSQMCSIHNDFSGDSFPEVGNKPTDTLSHVYFRSKAGAMALQQLDVSKASGHDSVPARVLKMCVQQLAVPLCKLFRLSFNSGIQPKQWKIASVVPIHKKKSRAVLSNYRPVSLFSVISKVTEGMVNRQLLNFSEKNSILLPNQFGFRQGKGAADLLTYLHNQWSNVAGAGGAVHVLAVDIAGAFDRVSNAGVLEKARCYGIRGRLLCWLRDYPKERKLCTVVHVHGQTFSLYPITAGVPQESILGPTLFLLYINDCDVNLPDDVHI